MSFQRRTPLKRGKPLTPKLFICVNDHPQKHLHSFSRFLVFHGLNCVKDSLVALCIRRHCVATTIAQRASCFPENPCSGAHWQDCCGGDRGSYWAAIFFTSP